MRTAAVLFSVSAASLLLAGCEVGDPYGRTNTYYDRDDYRSLDDVRDDWEYNRRLAAKEHADFQLYLEGYAERVGKTTLELSSTDRARAHSAFRREFGWKYHYRRYPYRHYYDQPNYRSSAPPPAPYRKYYYDDDSWW